MAGRVQDRPAHIRHARGGQGEPPIRASGRVDRVERERRLDTTRHARGRMSFTVVAFVQWVRAMTLVIRRASAGLLLTARPPEVVWLCCLIAFLARSRARLGVVLALVVLHASRCF